MCVLGCLQLRLMLSLSENSGVESKIGIGHWLVHAVTQKNSQVLEKFLEQRSAEFSSYQVTHSMVVF